MSTLYHAVICPSRKISHFMHKNCRIELNLLPNFRKLHLYHPVVLKCDIPGISTRAKKSKSHRKHAKPQDLRHLERNIFATQMLKQRAFCP